MVVHKKTSFNQHSFYMNVLPLRCTIAQMVYERTFSLLLSCLQFSTTPMGRPPRKSVPEVFPFLIQAPSKFLTRLQFMRISPLLAGWRYLLLPLTLDVVEVDQCKRSVQCTFHKTRNSKTRPAPRGNSFPVVTLIRKACGLPISATFCKFSIFGWRAFLSP